MTDTYDYDAWGNAVNVPGPTPNLYRYRGEQYDPDLRLYYLRARYFNPLTGRFLTRDPESGKLTDPGTLHKYLYTGADPVTKFTRPAEIGCSGRSGKTEFWWASVVEFAIAYSVRASGEVFAWGWKRQREAYANSPT